MEIGGVTVFGLPAELPVWVDARVMERERIVLGGGSRSWKVIAPPSILLALPGRRGGRGPRDRAGGGLGGSSEPAEPVRTLRARLSYRSGS